MPSSRAERIAFGVGLALIGILAALVLPAWKGYSDDDVSSVVVATPIADTELASAAKVSPAEKRAVVLKGTATAVESAPAPARPSRRPPAATNAPVKLTVAAARGDCWLSIRRESATGAELFTGTLVKGKSLSFPLGKLWIRFGAPQNVEARIGGKKAVIPTSGFNVLVTRSGVTDAPEA